jgi:hypothetical protein
MLFDTDVARVDAEPAGYAEPHFAYLNRAARSDAAAVRSVAEAWFAAYPDAAKADLRSRFRSPDRYPHYSAFFELYSHALLSRLGLAVDVHRTEPGVPAARAPDFRVARTGEPAFLVEATLATNLSAAKMAAEARLNQVYDALNGTDSPNFFIGVHVHGMPDQPVPERQLRRMVEGFFQDLDPDQCTQLISDGGLDAVPKLQVEINGWRIDILPFPKSPASRGKPGIRPLGMRGPAEASWIDDSTALREAVVAKAAHYGDLGCPFVVAVNAVNQHLDMTDAMEALFGKESYTIPVVMAVVASRLCGGWRMARGRDREDQSTLAYPRQSWRPLSFRGP